MESRGWFCTCLVLEEDLVWAGLVPATILVRAVGFEVTAPIWDFHYSTSFE